MASTKKSALPYKTAEHYSNILLLAPDGQGLATIPAKRARWYKKRKLVEVLDNRQGYAEVLRLLVEPSGRPSREPTRLENRCVVCGSTEQLSSHHVVPKAIRAHFPPEEKNHTSNWCVLVCEDHHLAAEKLARTLYEVPYQEATSKAHKVHAELCRNIILDFLARGGERSEINLIPQQIGQKQAVKIAQAECAAQIIESCGGIEATKQRFKMKFLELEPRFLPDGFLSNDWQK